ncbi:MAG: hypothetical protein PHQ67_01510 [Fermentimonas sp.]|nr:hypothetical protein [Fermentimonas sp.]MDD4008469.1 hypothetical protein [Fermentimonas sp.]MDD4696920.1 hypothetical protein [Fermentimonas sp.]
MKYNVLIYNPNNPHAIGEVSENIKVRIKHAARYYVTRYKGKSGRIILEDQKTGRIWGINS